MDTRRKRQRISGRRAVRTSVLALIANGFRVPRIPTEARTEIFQRHKDRSIDVLPPFSHLFAFGGNCRARVIRSQRIGNARDILGQRRQDLHGECVDIVQVAPTAILKATKVILSILLR